MSAEKPVRIPAKALNSLDALVEHGVVPQGTDGELRPVEENFSIRLTPETFRQMRALDVSDPVYAQYVPSTDELYVRNEEMADPIGDETFQKVKGITHRYPDRLLLKPTHTCQVYCRFCFRREKVGQADEALSHEELEAALDYIARTPDIWEVILSGGDPLILSDRRLGAILRRISELQHVDVIRFHTRVPIVDPGRITDDLVAALKTRAAVYVVVHVNHPNELTDAVRTALARLADAGIPLLSQTVLLKGVNNNVDVLARLMRDLVRARVKPYYLHHLDKAKGTGHFRCSIADGQKLVQALRGRLSGLCQPTYVLDIPGGHGKVPIGPSYIIQENDGSYVLRDYLGGSHSYEGGADPTVRPDS
ncbi:lysine-2,3-aminomutase-like protein [Nordella sp. HKS 07]|uniref:lysine-2,3-aminomutase-like protein n=1 Tax=Nordella sp. HKS 07 TaxID=2712222 RepID=UPI0013E13A50|nr:lysine-2,3-aminomutase-like protein [Nordella sp. HKS 07]QIG47556.1 lysine-2,3-aminomutase-like protein [Nordella sp. HKS 07]